MRFPVEAVFKAMDKFSGPVARMTTRMDRFRRITNRGLRGIRRNAKRVMRGMRSLALSVGSLAAAAALGLKGLLKPAVDFEHAIAGIDAKTRGAISREGRLNDIRKKALELGGATVFTSIQVAEAMQDLAKAGLSTTEILGGIEPILHAAGAEGANISDISKVIVSTMKAFDKPMTLKNTTRMADVFANVAANAKTSILELAEGVSKFAPVAHMFGFAAEDAIAFVAALQDVGIEASMSGTQLKTMMSRLAKLSPAARAEFAKLGIDVRKSLEAGDAPGVISELMRGLDRAASKTQKVRAMTEAFGQRGMVAGMLLAMSEGKKSGGLKDLLDAAGESANGAAAEMYKLQQATTKGAFTELSSAWETFRIEVGKGTLPAMKGLADSIADILRDPENIKAVSSAINSAVEGIKKFWDSNKELLKAAGAVIWSALKLGAQLIGGIWNLLAPMRYLLTFLMNILSTVMDAIAGIGDLLNNTVLGKLINKWLGGLNEEEKSRGVQVNGPPETTRIGYQGNVMNVENPHGLEYVLGVDLSPDLRATLTNKDGKRLQVPRSGSLQVQGAH